MTLNRIAIVALVFCCLCEGAIIYRQKDLLKQQRRMLFTSAPQKVSMSFAGSPAKGSASAPVVIVEFSEFTCVYCGRHARTVLPALDREYIRAGKVQYVSRNFVLDSMEPKSNMMAKVALCSMPNQYWSAHELFFGENPPDILQTAGLKSYAAQLHLDFKQLVDCLKEQSVLQTIARDRTEGRVAGVEGTPTFFIGQRVGSEIMSVARVFKGSLPIEEFRLVIDDLLTNGKPAGPPVLGE
jgi:protein-disulfide isomerase